MTLLDAKSTIRKKSGKKNAIISIIVLILIWPAWVGGTGSGRRSRIANKFFSALQQQNFKPPTEFIIRSRWQQHPQNHSHIPSTNSSKTGGQAVRGASSRVMIYGESNCPGGGTGVVVDVS